MPTPLKNREDNIDERQEARFNPQQLQDAERGQDSYNAEAEQMDAALRDEDPEYNQRFSKNSEQLGDPNWQNNYTGNPMAGEGKGEMLKMLANNPRAAALNLAKVAIKKKSPIMAVFAIVAFFGFFSLAGSSMAAFSMLENIQTDLDDLTAVLTTRADGIHTDRNLPGADKGKAIAGCTKLSIRCKFATISSKQERRLNKAGIEITGRQAIGGGVTKRIVPTEYKFRSKTYSAAEWNAELRVATSPVRRAQLRANNMKFIGFNDKSFAAMVLRRFGVSKKPPGIAGSTEDRINQLLTKTKAEDIDGVRITDDGRLLNQDGTPVTDASGKEIVYTPDQIAAAREAIEVAGTNKSPSVSRVPKGLVGAASVFGAADMACSIMNMVGAATIAANVATRAKLVPYAFDLAKAIHEVKSGEGTEQSGQVIGRIIGDPDMRKLVVDIAATSAAVAGTDRVMKSNPNYGRTMTDASLVTMSSYKGVPKPNTDRMRFSLGATRGTALGATTQGIAWLRDNPVSNSGCAVAQNPLVRGLGIALSVIAAPASGGLATAAQITLAAVMVPAMYLVNEKLVNALTGDPTDVFRDPNETVTRGEAFWTGIAAINGSNALAHGLAYGNKNQINKYYALRSDIENEYMAMERETANPLDINNQYSTLGSISRSFYKAFGTIDSPTKILSVPGVIGSSLSTNASAAISYNEERFTQWGESEQAKMGIDLDVQGNERYVATDADLEKTDIDEVMNYMELRGCGGQGCVSEDTTTGIPEGYTIPDPGVEQQTLIQKIGDMAKSGFIENTVGNFVDVNDIKLNTDYKKWLTYCRFRTSPPGLHFQETGLFGAVSDSWKTGKKCMEDGEISYFRVYTQYLTALEGIEEESYDLETAATGGAAGGVVQPFSGTLVSPIAPGSTGVIISANYGNYPSGGVHYGIDLASGTTYDVVSACDGTVEAVLINPSYANVNAYRVSGSTNYVWINCGNNVLMGYAHFFARDLKSYVTPGAKIGAGTVLFPQGNQGNSSGAHLHFQVSTIGSRSYTREATTDPKAYLAQFGVGLP